MAEPTYLNEMETAHSLISPPPSSSPKRNQQLYDSSMSYDLTKSPSDWSFGSYENNETEKKNQLKISKRNLFDSKNQKNASSTNKRKKPRTRFSSNSYWTLSTFTTNGYNPSRLTARQQMDLAVKISELPNAEIDSQLLCQLSPYVLDRAVDTITTTTAIASPDFSSNTHNYSSSNKKTSAKCQKLKEAEQGKNSTKSKRFLLARTRGDIFLERRKPNEDINIESNYCIGKNEVTLPHNIKNVIVIDSFFSKVTQELQFKNVISKVKLQELEDIHLNYQKEYEYRMFQKDLINKKVVSWLYS